MRLLAAALSSVLVCAAPADSASRSLGSDDQSSSANDLPSSAEKDWVQPADWGQTATEAGSASGLDTTGGIDATVAVAIIFAVPLALFAAAVLVVGLRPCVRARMEQLSPGGSWSSVALAANDSQRFLDEAECPVPAKSKSTQKGKKIKKRQPAADDDLTEI